MKKLTISFVLFIVPLITMAQTNVSGNVVDAEGNGPLVGASIIIKDDNGKIIKFTTTKDDGTYTLQLSSAKDGILEVVMMGYKKQSIPLAGVVLPLTVYLEPGSISLKEVVVKADPMIEVRLRKME